jgi:thiamine-phosphate pyrophosphorylase
MKSVEGLHVLIGGLEKSRMCELARIAEGEGAAVVQLREKERGTREVLDIADSLRAILKDTTFIINDRADIALAVGADGVHLGQDDLPIEDARELLGEKAIIGVSTGNLEEALQAERAGANYLGFGHMFATPSKLKINSPRTVEELRSVIAAISIPVIAIGGINESNLEDILTPGLGGVAVISAINSSKDPQSVIREFVARLKQYHAVVT